MWSGRGPGVHRTEGPLPLPPQEKARRLAPPRPALLALGQYAADGPPGCAFTLGRPMRLACAFAWEERALWGSPRTPMRALGPVPQWGSSMASADRPTSRSSLARGSLDCLRLI